MIGLTYLKRLKQHRRACQCAKQLGYITSQSPSYEIVPEEMWNWMQEMVLGLCSHLRKSKSWLDISGT